MLICLQMLETEEEKSRFRQLYELYDKLMFHIARRFLKEESDVEDAVYQAYVALIENFHRIPQVDSQQTKAYVVIVTERKALDVIRRQSRIIEMEFDETAHGIEFGEPESGGLAEAMAELPARYREALLLRYHNGYSTREIAQMLSVRPETAKRLLTRAKLKLEQCLNKGET